MSKEQVFAELNNINKVLFYEGLETDTVSVNVDYNNREISANVIMQGILGEDFDKAFPGEEGKKLRKQLLAEIERSKAADRSIEVVNNQLLNHYNWLTGYLKIIEDSLPKKVSQLENDLNFVTGSELEDVKTDFFESIRDTQKKIELLSNVVNSNKVELQAAITNLDSKKVDKSDLDLRLLDYAKNEDVAATYSTKDELTTAVESIYSNINSTLESYATKDHVQSNYVATQEFESSIEDIKEQFNAQLESYATIDHVQSTYTTKEYVDTALEDVKISLENLTEVLNALDFIDGGDSSSININ